MNRARRWLVCLAEPTRLWRGVSRRVSVGWVRRSVLMLLLAYGWFWQQHQHVGVVEAFMTTAQARPSAAYPVTVYRARTPWVCVYLVYNDARPGKDTYSTRFSRGSTVFFQDIAHPIPVRHGVSLNCYATGGNLEPGQYTALVLLDGETAGRIPFTVASPAAAP